MHAQHLLLMSALQKSVWVRIASVAGQLSLVLPNRQAQCHAAGKHTVACCVLDIDFDRLSQVEGVCMHELCCCVQQPVSLVLWSAPLWIGFHLSGNWNQELSCPVRTVD